MIWYNVVAFHIVWLLLFCFTDHLPTALEGHWDIILQWIYVKNFLAPLLTQSAELIKSGDRLASVRRPSVRLSVVNNSFESLLLLQFSTNLNQTWHKVRTPRGAKIVGSGILNFCFVWEKADDFVIFQQFIQIATPPTVLNQS